MSRFPIPAPRSDEGTILPAALLAALVLMIALQLWLTGGDAPMPASEASLTLAPYTPPRMMVVPVLPAISEQPIFSPARSRGGDGGEGDGDMLAGAQLAGATSVAGRSQIMLRKADGTAASLGVGQMLNGWQLVAVTSEGARFVRAGRSALIPFGASAPRSKTTSEDQPEEEQQ